jgi:hypothetical protein
LTKGSAPEHCRQLSPPALRHQRHQLQRALDPRGVAHQPPDDEEHLSVGGAEGVPALDHVRGDGGGVVPLAVADEEPQQAAAHGLRHVEASVRG